MTAFRLTHYTADMVDTSSATPPCGGSTSQQPSPTHLQPTHVLVQVHYSAATVHDAQLAAGHLRRVEDASLPLTAGSDFSGTVLQVL